MATHWTLLQKDLFELTPPVGQLAETERQRALDLLQALLAEALNQAQENATENRMEACDDEDIA
jgi:hypothetical protein